jgi:hypothetical protein
LGAGFGAAGERARSLWGAARRPAAGAPQPACRGRAALCGTRPPARLPPALLVLGAIHHYWHARADTITVDLPLVIEAAFCAASAMIAFGAVLGKTTPTELVWLIACMVGAVLRG